MKNIILILLTFGITYTATAQPKLGPAVRQGAIIGGGGNNGVGKAYVRPNVTIVAPYARPSYGMGYGFRPAFGYSPFYDPFYMGPRVIEREPSALELEIEDIENEYDFRINSVKEDESLDRKTRKQQVRELKHEREDAIIEAKKSYYNKRKNERKNQ